jgi:antitoxin component YwqK of YwqJK toxin-antitoxin module
MNKTVRTFYKNKQQEAEINYVIGDKSRIRHGSCTEWYTNGNLKMEGSYKDGKLHGPYFEYYEDGQLALCTGYADGKQFGRYERWYGNGAQRYLGAYGGDDPNDEKVGKWQIWYQYKNEDGTSPGGLHAEGEYCWNQECGEWTYWDQDGNVISEGHWSDLKYNNEWAYWDDSKLNNPPKPCSWIELQNWKE